MNDEIKDYVTPTLEYLKECVEDDVRFETSNCKALLDYITNLQEEYRQTKLLKERYQLEKEDYKSRIDNSIEYIKDSGITFLNLANQRCFCNNNCADKILNILKGDKDE